MHIGNLNKFFLLALAGCFSLCISRACANAPTIHFSVNEKTGAIVLKDLRNGRTWEQVLLADQPAQRLISYDAKSGIAELECKMSGILRTGKKQEEPVRVTAKLDPVRPEVELTFIFSGTGEWRQADYPYAFTMEEEDACNLYPHGEGMLVPVKRSNPDWIPIMSDLYYGGIHSFMACFGVLEPKSGIGIFTLLPSIESTMVTWSESAGGRTVAEFGWRPNKNVFDRPYKMIVSLYDKGGYVAMAKRYREWFADNGMRRSLDEKARQNPDINQLAGTTVFWGITQKTAELREMADLLKSNGVDRCLFAMPGIFSPQHHYADKADLAATIEHVNKLGYLSYRYDQFRDAFRADPNIGAHLQLNTDAWPEMITIQESGKMVQAFGPDSGVICPQFFLSLAKKHLPATFAEFPYKAWYLDCIGSVSFNFEGECWCKEHPADNFDARRERLKLMEYVTSLGKLTSTECGLDYLIPYVSWYEGGTSLVAYVEKFPPGVAAAGGAMDDADLWKRVAKAAPTEKVPWTVNLSTKYRIPFWSLAHHDEAVMTWRCEDGMHQQPAYWARKNLWSALYAAAPMYRPYTLNVRQFAAEIGRTSKYIGHVTSRVGMKAMTDHRFLTADRDVQETCFEGGFGVIANFGESAYKISSGPEIPPGEYVAYAEAAGKRNYLPPPCPNVFSK
ncbi:MAG: glycoside hydrolase [Verrucomicrobiota bacterium]